MAEDNTFKILIQLGVIGKEDAEAVKALLKETGEAAKEMDSGMGKMGEGTEEATDKAKLFQEEAGEMRKIIGELTHISPVLGQALRIAMNPVGGAVATAIGFFVLMKEHISKVNEELDAMGAKAAEPTFLAGIQAKSDVLKKAATAAGDYAAKLSSLKEGEHGITAELTGQLTLQAAINAARGEQNKADTALAKAQVAGAQARGEISPEVAAARLAAIDAKAIADEARDKKAAQEQAISTKADALDKAEKAQPEFESDATAKRKAYTDEAIRRAANKVDFGDYSKFSSEQSAALAELDKANAELETAKQPEFYQGTGYSLPVDKSGQVAEANKKIALAQAKLNSLKQGRELYEQDEKTQTQFDQMGRQAGTAEKLAEDNAATIGSLKNDLKHSTEVIQATGGFEGATTKSRVGAVAAGLGADLTQQNTKYIDDERRAIDRGDVAEFRRIQAEAQAHGRELVAAVKETAGANQQVNAAVLAALQDLRQKQETLAAQISLGAQSWHR